MAHKKEKKMENSEGLKADQASLVELFKSLTSQQRPAAGASWKDAPSQDVEIKTISIPISIRRDGRKMRAYLNIDGEFGSSPDALIGAIGNLEDRGYPIELWEEKGQKRGGWR
jgi:hypothetical protein